jgi:hypothetical protein
MIAHDPKGAPLDAGVRYTENGQPLAIGDGLWRTLTARGDHGVYLVGDEDVGVLTSTVETDIPGELTLRLRERQGRITEIEALIVRQEIPMLGKRQTARDYVQALNDKAAPIAFADECTARINGVDSVDNQAIKPLDARTGFHPFALNCQAQIDSGFYQQVGRVRESRVLLADAAQGIVAIAFRATHRHRPPRTDARAAREAELATEPDRVFRFHSGPPSLLASAS